MANEDNGMRFGDKSKIKKTVYRNGKLVKDEMEKSPRPKANPRAAAKPAAKPAAKKAEKPATPVKTPKVETMKGMAPSGGRGNGRAEMVVRTAEKALTKAASGKNSSKAASGKVTYSEWEKLSPAQRKAQGLPTTKLGVQTWGLKKGVMNK